MVSRLSSSLEIIVAVKYSESRRPEVVSWGGQSPWLASEVLASSFRCVDRLLQFFF
jgi:hypothetical protein